ncbi:EAL-associated domain-containing protein [Alkalicoccus chagannorensis]|uniref:EAL-associated domain-containing protein n=1 Tax=Alkalicoccus chagannorensis TaxID=427072 RepID=UPI00040DC94E|nr:EAL-associated domain-containing protein [Alkalicoccus chagannorensis]
MNLLDAADAEDQLQVALQPVIDAETCRMSGCEILGRMKTADGTVSLGPFFHSEDVTDEEKWYVDQLLYKQAVAYALQLEVVPKLFFNIHPAVLGPLDALEELFALLDSFEADGFPKENMVLEVRVEGFEHHLEELSHILLYMKASGYTTSLDGVKVTDTHLDQFSMLEPNIIKIGISDLKTSTSYVSYAEIIDTLAFFSRKIGASLHFQGIEDQHQLQLAWKYGGRYYQGYYLAHPKDVLPSPDILQTRMKESIHGFIDLHYRRLKQQTDFLSSMDDRIKKIWKKHSQTEPFLQELASYFTRETFRLYICDSYGYQISANWTKKDHEWIQEEDAEGKNWSWRIYFLDHVIQMEFNEKGLLSDKYRDIISNESIRTYSYPITKDSYLFMDIDPVFLYDVNWQ